LLQEFSKKAAGSFPGTDAVLLNVICFFAPEALMEQFPGVKRCEAARNPRIEEQ
jgi:hypothetical protein